MDGQAGGWTDGQAGRQSAKRVVRLTNGQRDKQTNGKLKEWTDKQRVRRIEPADRKTDR